MGLNLTGLKGDGKLEYNPLSFHAAFGTKYHISYKLSMITIISLSLILLLKDFPSSLRLIVALILYADAPFLQA